MSLDVFGSVHLIYLAITLSLSAMVLYFAKKYAKSEKVPLLFDTDMERYAQIYQHYGCELYNQTLASNGVTRYNLVWKIDV